MSEYRSCAQCGAVLDANGKFLAGRGCNACDAEEDGSWRDQSVPSLTINLCTRHRPHLLAWTVDKTLANITLPTTRLMISVDDDDMQTIKSLPLYPPDQRLFFSVEKREDSLGEKFNRALTIPATVYLAMVDYAPHVTPGFDAKILEAASLFPDNIGVVYNRLANASFPGINAVTHALAMKLGGLYPPHFPFWFIDHWLDDVARMIDRIAFCDVEIDTSRRPSTTTELRDCAFWGTFFDAAQIMRRRQALGIIDGKDFIEPAWRKTILRNHHPLIEYRSQWVNSQLRDYGPAIEAGRNARPPDERYIRIKKAAREVLRGLVAEMEAELQPADAAE